MGHPHWEHDLRDHMRDTPQLKKILLGDVQDFHFFLKPTHVCEFKKSSYFLVWNYLYAIKLNLQNLLNHLCALLTYGSAY